MKRLIHSLLACLVATLALSPEAQAGEPITVTISNVRAAKGDLLVGLYDSKTNFAKRPLPHSPKIRLTSSGTVVATIPDVPPGTYAIVVLHDVNKNGKLDKSLLGMPKEPFGFSNNPTIPRGMPAYSACTFTMGTSPQQMSIRLK